MAGLGRDQLDFAKQQYSEMKPLADQVAASQIAMQDEQLSQGRDYYNYMQNTYRPVEQGLVARAQEFDTEGYRNQLASQASADAARAFGNTQAQTTRGLSRMGAGPNSGAAQSQMNQNALASASMRAGAMTGSRNQSEQMGYARLIDAAGLGRGLSGASTGAYGAALAAGSTGINSAMAPGNQYMQGMGAGASTIGAGQQMMLGGLGNVLSSQTSAYNSGLNASGEFGGALLGAGATLGAAYLGMPAASDRRLKAGIELVGRDERTGLNLYEFSYKEDPTRRFIGVMADEVEAFMPQAVTTRADGYKQVNYSMLGIDMVEV
jgi:hypothetical protein